MIQRILKQLFLVLLIVLLANQLVIAGSPGSETQLSKAVHIQQMLLFSDMYIIGVISAAEPKLEGRSDKREVLDCFKRKNTPKITKLNAGFMIKDIKASEVEQGYQLANFDFLKKVRQYILQNHTTLRKKYEADNKGETAIVFNLLTAAKSLSPSAENWSKTNKFADWYRQVHPRVQSNGLEKAKEMFGISRTDLASCGF